MKSLLHVDLQSLRSAVVRYAQIVLVCAAMCMAGSYLPTLANAGQQAWTPPAGSSERKPIVNALRQEVKALQGLDVQFVITHRKVKDNWAWIQTRPQSSDGENRYEDIAALLRKTNGAWRVCEIPCTEPDNPDCLGEPDFFKRLQGRFPGVPREIFSGF
ncbi:MAG: hypothetical protein L6365_13945 [Desulfobulbaceae bacterium]|nr:hypothetical protein [Desulfobulbaceae bacterium]